MAKGVFLFPITIYLIQMKAMNKTNHGDNTPGDKPGISLSNPPSSEAGLKDSGGDRLLLLNDPFKKSGITKTPPNSSAASTLSITSNMNDQTFEENCSSIKNEKYFEKWKKSTQENQKFKDTLQTFQQSIEELENKIKIMKEKSKPNENKKKKEESSKIEYHTDEELLAEETEWIRAKNKSKKRKMNFSLSPEKQQTSSNSKQP